MEKKSFIEELQALEEPTKRKIFVVAIVVIMAAVVYVWFGYFNGIVLTASQSTGADGGQVQQVSDGTNGTNGASGANVAGTGSGGSSFFQNTVNGLADIGAGFVSAAHWIASVFEGPGKYNIQPTQ